MKTLKSIPWVEKYRPRRFEDVISLPATIAKLPIDDTLPNLLFLGRAGTGKTTVAKIIIKMLDAASLEMNASDERGIDTIRDKIKFFASQRSGGIKIVFLDEADNLTGDAQQALRTMMEEFASNTRFILAGNYERGLIEPIKSRCSLVLFSSPNRDAIVARLSEICDAEKVKYTEEALVELVKLTYPDIRRAINVLQASVADGEFKLELAKTSDTTLEAVWLLFKRGEVPTLRELLGQFPPNWAELYDLLYERLFTDENIEVDEPKRANAVRVIATWAYQSGFAANKELNFIGCVYETLSVLGW